MNKLIYHKTLGEGDKIIFLPFPNTKEYYKEFYALYFDKFYIFVNPKTIYFNLITDIIRGTSNIFIQRKRGYKFLSLVILNNELCYINYGSIITNIIQKHNNLLFYNTNPSTLVIKKEMKHGYPSFEGSHIMLHETVEVGDYLNEYRISGLMGLVMTEFNLYINKKMIENNFDKFYKSLLELNDEKIIKIINSIKYAPLLRKYKLEKLGLNE